MARGDGNALVAIVAIGALLAAIWLGSKKRCHICGTENDRTATNCGKCGWKI